jgi:hypothetical protein
VKIIDLVKHDDLECRALVLCSNGESLSRASEASFGQVFLFRRGSMRFAKTIARAGRDAQVRRLSRDSNDGRTFQEKDRVRCH